MSTWCVLLACSLAAHGAIVLAARATPHATASALPTAMLHDISLTEEETLPSPVPEPEEAEPAPLPRAAALPTPAPPQGAPSEAPPSHEPSPAPPSSAYDDEDRPASPPAEPQAILTAPASAMGAGDAMHSGSGTSGSGAVAPGGAKTSAGPAKSAAAPRVLSAAGVHRPPRELTTLRPAYPFAALRRRAEGSVKVRLLIDESGRVASAAVLHVNGHDSFRDAALSAAPSWRFTPAMHDGQPVKVWAERTLTFTLPSQPH